MVQLPYILFALATVILAGVLFQLYRVQKSSILRTLHLLSALTQRQYARRTDSSDPGAAGELAVAANALAENLESRAAKAQQDSDHLLTLLAVLDHTNEIALATDPTDNIRLVNPAAARVLGRPAEQLLGKPLDSVLTHRELLSLYRKAFHVDHPISAHVTLGVGEQEGGVAGVGRQLHCHATAATIYNGAHYRGTFLLLRDITEAARTLQIKTDFVANASHELRTPLASIRAAVETLRDPSMDSAPVDAEAAGRCIDIIHNHALRLEMIITDLLDLSRAEDPGGNVRRERVDIAAAADQAIGLFAAAGADKPVELRREIAGDAGMICGDERLLQLVLKNLLDNAMKFTSQGSITIRSYRARSPLPVAGELDGTAPLSAGMLVDATLAMGDSVVVEVADTGCGIPVEDQERVFERFYTVNRSRGGADRGTGLGLAIVKHAVAAMKGHVSLESEVGKGTTLRCHFPAPGVKEEGGIVSADLSAG